MKIHLPFIRIFSFLLCLICIPVAAQTTVIKKPILDIQNWKTSEGTPVYFVRTPELPMVDIKIIFTAGSAYDNAEWGIASFVASLLNEGTKEHNADQIANIFDQVGAQFSNDTNQDFAVISLRSLTDSNYLTPALKMFNEVLSQAAFPDNALNRIKQQTLSAIRQQQQDPSAVATDTFYNNLYPDHPYGHPVLGTLKTVNAITKNQAQAFYQRYFVSSNAQIILVGNLDRPAAEKIAQNLMNALPQGAPAPKLATEDRQPSHITHALAFPSQQTTIMTGQLGIDRQNSQYFPLMVGNYLLGQMPLGSLLFEQVRNQRGLAYNASSALSLMTYRGPFLIVLQTRTEKKNEALDITEKVLRDYISKGPDLSQLELAKQNIINHFPLNLSTNDDIATILMQMAVNRRPLDYLDAYQGNVRAVTAEQIKQAFQALINPDKMLTVTVGQP